MAFTSTILCVDDDEDDLLFIREAIAAQPHPFEIAEAQNGFEAIEILRKAVETEALPCLVIMDMNMPKMDGKQAVTRIREMPELAPVPIVLFTTSTNKDHRAWFEDQGVHFISKPYDYGAFKSQIHDLLRLCAGL